LLSTLYKPRSFSHVAPSNLLARPIVTPAPPTWIYDDRPFSLRFSSAEKVAPPSEITKVRLIFIHYINRHLRQPAGTRRLKIRQSDQILPNVRAVPGSPYDSNWGEFVHPISLNSPTSSRTSEESYVSFLDMDSPTPSSYTSSFPPSRPNATGCYLKSPLFSASSGSSGAWSFLPFPSGSPFSPPSTSSATRAFKRAWRELSESLMPDHRDQEELTTMEMDFDIVIVEGTRVQFTPASASTKLASEFWPSSSESDN
jgi:hypothetical protein